MVKKLFQKKDKEELAIPDKFYEKDKDSGNKESALKSKLNDWLSEEGISFTKKESLIFIVLLFTVLHTGLLIFRYFYCTLFLDRHIISNNPLYLIPVAVIPFIAWIHGTTIKFFAFHNRKIAFLLICVLNAVLTVMEPIYYLLWHLVVNTVFSLEVNAAMTERMVINLGRMCIIGGIALILAVIYRILEPFLTSEEAKERIANYSLLDTIDTRDNIPHRYDLVICKELESGKPKRIFETDRFLHVFVDGTTGTGKTSSVYLPAVNNDLKVKAKNKEIRQEKLAKIVLQDKATISKDFKVGEQFSETFIIPNDNKVAEEIAEVTSTYQDCGITIVAPNPAHIEKILKLCQNYGNIPVNIVDPMNEYHSKYPNARDLGFNPFFIPFDLPEEECASMIAEKADSFAQVMVAVNEMGSKVDSYFHDINTSVFYNISIVVMKSMNIQKKQTTIADIHDCVTNYDSLTKHIDTVEKHFGFRVYTRMDRKNAAAEKEKGKKGVSASVITPDDQGDGSGQKKQAFSFGGIPELSDEEYKQMIDNPYYYPILFVRSELLGEGAADMYKQSRGLRNLLDKFLNNPRIEALFRHENPSECVDFEKMLSDGQITLVNTAIDTGAAKSTGLGLFFILLFKFYVFKRPGNEDTRIPHFLYTDEAAQYIVPDMEQMAMIFRQYRVSCLWAIQNMNQFSKNETAKYIGNLMNTLGTSIVFGRVSIDEMKMYSGLSGTEKVASVQKTISSASILDANAQMSFSERTSTTDEDILSGRAIRKRKFQEATVFSVRNSSVQDAVVCKFDFVPKSDFSTKHHYRTVDWTQFIDEEDIEEVAVEKDDSVTDKAVSDVVDRLGKGNKVIIENNEFNYSPETIEKYMKGADSLGDPIDLTNIGDDEEEYSEEELIRLDIDDTDQDNTSDDNDDLEELNSISLSELMGFKK